MQFYNQRKTLLIIFLVFVGMMRVLTLSSHPLLDPTESRYAEIPREMVSSGDWITPQLVGMPFWGKPPLSFWLTAESYTLLGVSEFSTRLPSFLLWVLSLALTYVLALEFGGTLFALGSAAILATTGMSYVLSGMVMTDPTLSASVTLTMVAFVLALRRASAAPRSFWNYMFFFGLACSLLAKGLIGPAISILPIVAWCVWQKKKARDFASFPWLGGISLMLLVALPWHLLAELKTPGFLNYYVIGEHFKRYFVSDWQGNLYGKSHREPMGMIWAFFAVGSLPWSAVAFFSLRRLKKQGVKLGLAQLNEWSIFLLFWMLAPMVFFTPARNILAPYVLPAFPPFAILSAMAVRSVLHRCEGAAVPAFLLPRIMSFYIFFVPVGFTITAYTLLTHMGVRNSQKALVAKYEELAKKEGTATELLYFGVQPYSSEWYSGGAVRSLNEVKKSVTDELNEDDRVYFAVPKGSQSFPEDGWQRTEDVGNFGKFSLRRELLDSTPHSFPRPRASMIFPTPHVNR